jgi:hypothetical protein
LQQQHRSSRSPSKELFGFEKNKISFDQTSRIISEVL